MVSYDVYDKTLNLKLNIYSSSLLTQNDEAFIVVQMILY